MRCAYCGQPCKPDLYGNDDYEERDAEMPNGMDITLYIHDKCLPKILGEWTMNRVHSPQYGPQYNYVPRITCDTTCERVLLTKEE